ncbi:protein disulfide oxidoreductase [Dechloromonas denitrificans]|uniref:protein disulfide oxidoreductase n=1 Tax=Dechloromonas denitrificans TaxID=281362 RepID=UPI001CF8AF2E|nr:protein disulfide oxidoreductase [Dechloromonas denitrificans]UCV04406.1 protein disulfide oxidoreductase [Dechloromonas denitrificans]
MSDQQTPPAAAPARPRWRRWAAEAALFLGLFVAFQLWQARDTPRGPAPHFAGQLLDGQAFDLAAWRARHPGQAGLLYFWAEWCPICRTTAGNVSAVAADWPVTSIAVQSGSSEQIGKLMQQRDYRWSTLPDPNAAILKQYGQPGTPAFIVINPAGDVRFVSVGYTSEIGLRLRLWWASR